MVIAAKAVGHVTASEAPMRESQIEKYLVKRVKELGGEVRKVQWVGRRSAPDRLVMLPSRPICQVVPSRKLLEYFDAVMSRPTPKTPEIEAELNQIMFRAKYTKPPFSVWVEVKNPETIKTFPADAHERAQAREHKRMRKLGQHVVVIGTIEQVEELLA